MSETVWSFHNHTVMKKNECPEHGLLKVPQIGDYQIHKLVGSGFSSHVYKVRKTLEPYYALKISSSEKKGSLRKEYDILKSLDHNNIVKAWHYWENESILHWTGQWDCILLDYGEIDLLELIMSHDHLSERMSKTYFRQMVSAIHYLHSRNIIHSDIKCENFILHGPILKLIDFGLARPYDSDSLLINTCGTEIYASPEQLYGYPHKGPESDVWGLGCCLYAMLNGLMPFSGDKSDPYKELQVGLVFRADISRKACSLTTKILVLNHEKRPTVSDIFYDPWLA